MGTKLDENDEKVPERNLRLQIEPQRSFKSPVINETRVLFTVCSFREYVSVITKMEPENNIIHKDNGLVYHSIS